MIDLARRLRPATRDPRLDRALARAPRALAATLAAVLIIVGLRTIIAGPPPAPARARAQAPTIDLGAQGYATEIADAYLAYDPTQPEVREQALKALVGEGFGSGVGLEPPPRTTQRVIWARPVQDQAAIAGGRLITVAVQTDRHGLVHLSVPVARDAAGRLRLAGYPALIGAPELARNAAPPARRAVADEALARVARRAVANYLARDAEDLQADLAAGARVALPALALAVDGSADVAVAGPAGVLVTVRARDDDGARYTFTYELGVAFAGRWYVTAVHAFPNLP
jgi:hypothetical protein